MFFGKGLRYGQGCPEEAVGGLVWGTTGEDHGGGGRRPEGQRIAAREWAVREVFMAYRFWPV